jgi:hypothetical protein
MSQSMEPSAASTGLMAFWARIDADYLLRFQQWHNCEHVPERVSIPGFLRGRRYRDLEGAPFFLMFYETVDSTCLGSPPYLAALNSPTPWTKEALGHFREPARNVYTLRAQFGNAAANPAPYLTTMRFNLDAKLVEDLQSNWLSKIETLPAVRRVRLFEVDETITAITTSERKIYGDGPGAQQYAVFVEANVPHAAWSDSVATALSHAFAGNDPRANLRSDRLWLEFGYTASLRTMDEHK